MENWTDYSIIKDFTIKTVLKALLKKLSQRTLLTIEAVIEEITD